MTALVVIGGWGLPVEVLEPLARDWRGECFYFGLDQPLSSVVTTPEAFADTLLAQVPDGAVWLGWSLGGQLAMLAASRAVIPPAGVVTLCSTPAFVERPGWELGMARVRFEAFVQGMRANAEREWRRFLLLQIRGDERATEARRALNPWLEQGVPAALASLQCTLGWLETLDLRELWQAPPCPALHILGARDPLVDAAIAEQPGMRSRFLSIPEMAHWPHSPYWGSVRQSVIGSIAAWE